MAIVENLFSLMIMAPLLFCNCSLSCIRCIIAQKPNCSADRLSDDDSDTMVDDPSDVDFVPRAKRRSTRLPLRSQRTCVAFPAVSQPSLTTPAGHVTIPKIQQPSSQKLKPSPFLPHCSPRQSVKMHCANCYNALQKGQTAYQRKGMPQLFCSSACLVAFTGRPHRKNPCVYCKR